MNLLPDQIDCVSFCLDGFSRHKGIVNASGMGTGKTAVAIECMKRIPGPHLVISPAYIVGNWSRHLALWGSPGAVCVIDSSRQRLHAADVYLVSYDMATRYKAIHEQLMAKRWGLLVTDELHYLKAWNTTRSRLILGTRQNKRNFLANVSGNVLGLTGTPLLNRIEELFNIVSRLAPAVFKGATKTQFLEHFSERLEYTPWGVKYHGLRYEDQLKAMLADCMIRKTKIEGLPERRDEDIFLDAKSPEVRRALEAEEAWLREHNISPDDLDTVKRLGAMDGSIIAQLRQTSALLRVPTACELVGDLVEKGARVLVYSYHRAVEAAFSARMRKVCEVGTVTGAVTIKARTVLVDRMQAENLPVLSATISSLKEGVDITAAEAVVFIEEDWTPANNDQGIARVWRRGQGKTVTVYRLGFTSGIDAYIRRAVKVKRDVIDKIIER